MSRTKGAKNKPKLSVTGDQPMPETTQETKTENIQTAQPVDNTHVKIGGIDLEIQSRKLGYVPSGQTITGYSEEISRIAYAIKTNKAVLMIGETGVGKTALVRYLAQETKNGFRRLNLNGQTTVDEFVGKIMLNDKGTFWQDGVLLDAMRNGYWLLLDEINAALPEILFVLHSLLDDDGYVVLAEKDGEVVKPHKDFRIFATMNPSGRYVGTKELNKAFLSRFPMILQLDFPQEKHEIDIVKVYSKIDQKEVYNLVRMANDLRQSYKKGEINFLISTRDLINCAKISEDIGMKEAIQLSILNRCEEEDGKAVGTVVALYFGKTGQRVNVVNFEEEYKRSNERIEQAKKSFEGMIGAIRSSQKFTNEFFVKIKPAMDSGFMGEAVKEAYGKVYTTIETTDRMCEDFTQQVKAWK